MVIQSRRSKLFFLKTRFHRLLKACKKFRTRQRRLELSNRRHGISQFKYSVARPQALDHLWAGAFVFQVHANETIKTALAAMAAANSTRPLSSPALTKSIHCGVHTLLRLSPSPALDPISSPHHAKLRPCSAVSSSACHSTLIFGLEVSLSEASTAGTESYFDAGQVFAEEGATCLEAQSAQDQSQFVASASETSSHPGLFFRLSFSPIFCVNIFGLRPVMS